MAAAALALALTAPACSQPMAPPQADFVAAAPAWTSFDFFRERSIFLPATVNGQSAQVMLDSGAGMTTLDTAFAARLGLKPTRPMTVQAAGGPTEAKIATGVDITAAGLHLKNVSVLILDLSAIGAQMGRPLPMILGREVFEVAMVDIDFPGRRIAFHDPKAFTAPAGATNVPLQLIDDQRRLDISIEGAAPIPAEFDLGNMGAVSVSSDYARRSGLLNGRPTSDTLAGGVGGLSVHDEAVLSSVKLSGIELRDVPALFNRVDNQAPRRGANLGMAVFSRFRLITDYPHSRLLLGADPVAAAQPFLKDRSGLRAMFAGDRLKVMYVSKGSPAQADGWKVGDEIVAVDGEAVSRGYLNGPHATWSAGAAGQAVSLTLGDGAKRTLTLRDYF